MFLVGTVLGGAAAPLLAQTGSGATQPPARAQRLASGRSDRSPRTAAPSSGTTIRSISGQRQPAARARDDPRLRESLPGQTYTAATLDQALKDLYATQLFADVVIERRAKPAISSSRCVRTR